LICFNKNRFLKRTLGFFLAFIYLLPGLAAQNLLPREEFQFGSAQAFLKYEQKDLVDFQVPGLEAVSRISKAEYAFASDFSGFEVYRLEGKKFPATDASWLPFTHTEGKFSFEGFSHIDSGRIWLLYKEAFVSPENPARVYCYVFCFKDSLANLYNYVVQVLSWNRQYSLRPLRSENLRRLCAEEDYLPGFLSP